MDVVAAFAEPLPYTITAEMLGVPLSDAPQLKLWSQDFAEMLGNFQHNPERVPRIRRSIEDMTRYFHSAVREIQKSPRPGLIHSFLSAVEKGDRLSEDEVVANVIITMVGGQETTTNLIANGVLTLLRHPAALQQLRGDPSLVPAAVEEMLRYEPPSQQTARIAPADVLLGSQRICKGQAVIAVIAAANRDPERFSEPERFDIARENNRHLSFGWAAHFCFGAALARIEAQAAFEGLLRHSSHWSLEASQLIWRNNLGLRGLTALPVRFGVAGSVFAFQHSNSGTAVAASECQDSRGEKPDVSEVRRELVRLYLEGRMPRHRPDFDSIPKRPANQAIPMSAFQEQVWSRAQRPGSDPALFNETITIHREGPLEVRILERAFTEILRRHEAWRTTFDFVDGVPVQVIGSAPEIIDIPLVDLRMFSSDRREAEARRIVAEQAGIPFDLKQGALLRTLLLRMDENRYRFILTVHQAIADGVSAYQILPAELSFFYEGLCNGQMPSLPELPVQYGDFSAWHLDWLRGQKRADQIEHWRTKLTGPLPTLAWPSQDARPDRASRRGAILQFAVPFSVRNAVTCLVTREKLTLFQALLSGFVLLFHVYTGQMDLLIGTFCPSGRASPQTANLLGYFLNPVALRYTFARNPSFRQVSAQTRRILSDAISNDAIPIDHLRREFKLSEELDAVARVAISLQPRTPALSSKWDVTTMDGTIGGSFWDFYVTFIERDDSLLGRASFNSNVLNQRIVQALLADFWRLLEALALRPEAPATELLS